MPIGFRPHGVGEYADERTTALPPLIQELIAETQRAFPDRAAMLAGPIVGTLLQSLVVATGARRVLEIGMFTGYSALMMAEALPDDGVLVTCDLDPEHIAFARRYFDRSDHGRKIDVREGVATATLATLDGPFDVVFIDADKPNLVNYYEESLKKLSPRGVIAVDNTLWGGEVLGPVTDDGRAVAAFNDHVRDDERVVAVLLTVRSGLTVIRRRAD
jgi:caffeoyl-CoA O-methyltransferase